MVLYHCCMSAAHAQARVLVGFENDDLIEVTESSPDTSPGDPDAAYAVLLLGPPVNFRLQDYAARTGKSGHLEYLVPGRILNAFERHVWPNPGRKRSTEP